MKKKLPVILLVLGMSLELFAQISAIQFPHPLGLREINKLLNYLAEKIPAEITDTVSYKKVRSPYLLETVPLQIKKEYVSLVAIIHDTHENYRVILSAHEPNKLKISEAGFLPEINIKNFKQEKKLRNKIIKYTCEYFALEH